jgi:hypothetical protein
MAEASFWQPAEGDEQFMPGAFDAQIGKQVPVKGPGGEHLGLGTLVSADVGEDGSGVMLVFSLPEDRVPELPAPETGGMSFAFAEPDPDLVPRDPLSAKPPRIRP